MEVRDCISYGGVASGDLFHWISIMIRVEEAM